MRLPFFCFMDSIDTIDFIDSIDFIDAIDLIDTAMAMILHFKPRLSIRQLFFLACLFVGTVAMGQQYKGTYWHNGSTFITVNQSVNINFCQVAFTVAFSLEIPTDKKDFHE